MDSNVSLPSSVTVVKVDYDDISNLKDALLNHDILIITLSVTTPPSIHSNLVTAASAAGIRYIIPNAYGFDFRNPALIRDIDAAGLAHSYFSQIENLGMMHFSLVCGFWYEWSLGVSSFYGIDVTAKKVMFYDEGETKMNTSTWELCGNAVAGIVGLPIEELETKWRNKSFYVSSFRVNQREMLESVQRVLGQRDGEEWEVEYQTSKERYEQSMQEMREGDHMAFARGKFALLFLPSQLLLHLSCLVLMLSVFVLSAFPSLTHTS
jgi:hypothetical protein